MLEKKIGAELRKQKKFLKILAIGKNMQYN